MSETEMDDFLNDPPYYCPDCEEPLEPLRC